MRVILILAAALFVVACGSTTNNYIVFEDESFKPFEELTIEAGQSGTEDGGGGDGASIGGGGGGKLSPGGSNILDGYAQFALIFQLGGETPSTQTTSTPVTVDVPVTPGG